MKKKILYLCHRIPYPPNKGDKIRSFNEIKYLSKNNTIDLISLADDPEDLKYANMAEYVFKTDKSIKEIAKTLIMDFCDLDSDKWNLYAQKTTFPLNIIYKNEAARLLLFEKKINKGFHKSIFVSHKEAELFVKYYPEAKDIQVMSNGVDYQYFDQEKTEILQSFPSPMLVFSGAMDYYANIDGVTWFAKEILPEIKKTIPKIKFYIVGSNPDPIVKALEKDKSIIVTGFVKDIREYYKAADLCVIPLRIARGVQNKVLEAMAMGKAIVSTFQAVQGIDPEVKQALEIKDNPQEFAQNIVTLLNNKTRIKQLGSQARTFIIQNHNWGKNLNGFYDKVI